MTALLLLLSCVEVATEVAPAIDECGDWQSVGQPFALGYCASCHSSRLVGGARVGAPEGVDLETLAGMRSHRARVTARSLSALPDMPPQGGVREDEREALRRWYACDAPGDEAVLPEAEGVSGLAGAVDLTASVIEDDGVLVLGLEGGAGAWLTHRFVVDGSGVARLVGWVRTAGGGGVEAADYEPGLPVYDPETAELSATVTTAWESETGGGVRTDDWVVTRVPETDPDPRFTDQTPQRVTAARDGEPELHLWLSSVDMVVALAQRQDGGAWAAAIFQTRDRLRDADDQFPIEAGGAWRARGFVTEVLP
ncbi:MAG: hypothetical protein EXR71_17390 [Myxococcales bacterium]|nr:hypothetical protein [Myxococcales bacterium]